MKSPIAIKKPYKTQKHNIKRIDNYHWMRLSDKQKNAKKFITKGDKVKFTVKFKGREMQHVELGKKLMNRIIEDTKDIGKVETQPKFEGRQMIMIIQPN